MIKRIIEVSTAAKVSCKNKQLVVRRKGEDDASIPIEDIGILILDNPAITHTQGALSACVANNAAVIICDTARHTPTAMLLPFEGHSLQSKAMYIQTSASLPAKKRLWQIIVRAKIIHQAKVLKSTCGESAAMLRLANKVKSGDPENIEAQAAKLYWRSLFGKQFRRDRGASGVNALLNYGYAIMRAAVARAIVGAGMHPALGIHHHSQYNTFCFADDLLEPLRPFIDIKVHEIHQLTKEKIDLGRENKLAVLGCLSWQTAISGQKMPLMVALHHYAASVRQAIAGEIKKPEIPAL